MLTIVTNKQQLYEGRLVHHKNRLQPIKGNDTYCNLTVSKELHANFHAVNLSRQKKSCFDKKRLAMRWSVGVRLLVLENANKDFLYFIFTNIVCCKKPRKYLVYKLKIVYFLMICNSTSIA